MKAKVYSSIRIVEDVKSQYVDESKVRVIPKGTIGTVVESYQAPTEGYAVDLAIPDATLVGGFSYENVILYPEQFEVVNNG